MPTEVWYVLIVAALMAVVFAILKGSGLVLRKGKDGVEIEVKERSPATPQKPRIVVGEGAVLKDGDFGDIGGIINKGSGTVPVSAGAEIEVLKQGQLSGVRTGDIAGIKQDDRLETRK